MYMSLSIPNICPWQCRMINVACQPISRPVQLTHDANVAKVSWALYTDNPTYGRHPAVYTYAVRFDQDYCTFYNSLSTRGIPNVSTLDSSLMNR